MHFLIFTAPDTWKRSDQPALIPKNYHYTRSTIKVLSPWNLWKVKDPQGVYNYALLVPPAPLQWVLFPVLEDLRAFMRLYDGMDMEEFRTYLEQL